jgi:hypothetical protein
MSSRTRIVALSDEDYEDLIVEAYIDDECLMVVSQEHGFDALDVRFLPRRNGQQWTIKFDLLLELLQKSRKRLWELRRRSNESPTEGTGAV